MGTLRSLMTLSALLLATQPACEDGRFLDPIAETSVPDSGSAGTGYRELSLLKIGTPIATGANCTIKKDSLGFSFEIGMSNPGCVFRLDNIQIPSHTGGARIRLELSYLEENQLVEPAFSATFNGVALCGLKLPPSRPGIQTKLDVSLPLPSNISETTATLGFGYSFVDAYRKGTLTITRFGIAMGEPQPMMLN